MKSKWSPTKKGMRVWKAQGPQSLWPEPLSVWVELAAKGCWWLPPKMQSKDPRIPPATSRASQVQTPEWVETLSFVHPQNYRDRVFAWRFIFSCFGIHVMIKSNLLPINFNSNLCVSMCRIIYPIYPRVSWHSVYLCKCSQNSFNLPRTFRELQLTSSCAKALLVLPACLRIGWSYFRSPFPDSEIIRAAPRLVVLYDTSHFQNCGCEWNS